MINYYNVRLKGGVTTDRWSPPCDGAGTGFMTLSIPTSSAIVKAFLWAGECGSGNVLTVRLNGIDYTFNNSTRVGTPFNTSYGNNSSNHIIDITSDILPTVNNYTITVPSPSQSTPQINVSQRYNDFRLVVIYANSAFDVCNVVLFLNNQSMAATYNHLYNLSFIIPISTGADVALGMHVGYICNNTTNGNGSHDAENILVNSTLLGFIGSPLVTAGNGFCGGSNYKIPGGNFEYHNGTITALADCNSNLAMSGLDGLSDVVSLLSNGATAAVLECNSEEINNYSNNIWGCVWAYKDEVPIFPYECSAPNSVITSLITQTSARATWTYPVLCGGVMGDVNFQYRVVGNTTWTVVPLVAVGQYDIAGLTANTNYEYQIVSTNCAGAVCAPSAISTFSTLP